MSINIDPTLWGPSAWRYMHYITLSYPDNPTAVDRENVYNFFMLNAKLLPCEKCRNEFNKELQRNPLTNNILSSRQDLIIWLINVHNRVNERLGKPQMTYDQVINEYTHTTSTTSMTSYMTDYIYMMDASTVTIILIVILIAILLLMLRLRNEST